MPNDYDRDIRPLVMALAHSRGSWVRPECSFSSYARVDVASIEGQDLCGYEIKAQRDSLRRLVPPHGFQVTGFGYVFDRVTLVVAPKHLKRAKELVPAWWGLMVATDALETAREGDRNPEPAGRRLAQTLWVREARVVASRLGVRRGARDKADFIDRLSRCPEADLRREVMAMLPVRDWIGDRGVPGEME